MEDNRLRLPDEDGYQPSPEDGFQIVAFNKKQFTFVEWCLKLPGVVFLNEYGGFIPDPFTKANIAAVFYFRGPRFMLFFMNLVSVVLEDESSKWNRERCLKYGILSEIE